ncbi:MAG: prepilin-type N-terminal cleavage/methylation domain-containing protein [Planctomycetota bacterium]
MAPRQARGVTFIEVMVALAVVGLMAAMATAAIMQIERMREAVVHRRDALEVAHRVILQHIDDPKVLQGQVRRTPLNDSWYRFDLTSEVFQLEWPTAGGEETTVPVSVSTRLVRGAGFEELLKARLQRVTVEVYLDEPGHPLTVRGTPIATLTRVHNPLRDPERAFQIVIDMMSGELDEISGGN